MNEWNEAKRQLIDAEGEPSMNSGTVERSRRNWMGSVCLLVVASLLVVGCEEAASPQSGNETTGPDGNAAVDTEQGDAGQGPREDAEESRLGKDRQQMVAQQLAARDIDDPRVLAAMGKVPRHEFVPRAMRSRAYQDSPLPIGSGQTISQPYIVALMTQLVEPKPDQKALDIGTGSGYQAAVLSELVDQVFSIEIVESLAEEARARLQRLGYHNVQVRHGDGYAGWESEAPFDLIIVAAAPDHVPPALVEQLAPGGKLVIPIGDFAQNLMLIEKQPDGSIVQQNIAPVAFVPMTGEAEK